jgi:ribosomal protein S18 acetylase RimI-like enzyme
MAIEIRPALPEEAGELAVLMNMAGEGIPLYLWERMAEAGEEHMEVGARRVRRDEGGFSYRHAHVAQIGDAMAGMLLSYRLDDPYEVGNLDEYPEVVRPLVELEAMAPGSWYITAVAVSPDFRRRGVGTALMDFAEEQAREEDTGQISLIVADENRGAVELYEKLGYRSRGSRPVVGFPGFDHGGVWSLMIKELDP